MDPESASPTADPADTSSPYARIFLASPDAIVVADDQGRFVDVNPAACSLFWLSRERLVGCRLEDFVKPAAGSSPRHGRLELWIRRPDGEFRAIECVEVPGFLPGRHASFLRDVTDRKSSETLTLKFKSLIENSTDFIGFATTDGIPIYINNAGLTMMGLSGIADAQTRRVIDFHMEEDKAFVLNTIIPEVMKTGTWQGEFRFRHFGTGLSIPVFYTFFRIDDAVTGEVSGIATVTRDISESKRQRETLEANSSQLRLITDVMPQMVWTTAPDGTHLYFNKGWTDYTGLSLDESHGWGWQDVLHPDDLERTTLVWTRSLSTGNDYQIEYRMRGKDGSYRWQLARAQPLRDADGKILQWFGTCTDIEAQKNAQELLRAAQGATERERERLYGIFMDAPVVINVIRGEDLTIEFTNRMHQQLFGSGRKLEGLPLEEALPGIAPDLIRMHREVIGSGRRHVSGELSATLDYDNDGKPYEKIWHAIYQPLRNQLGAVDALMTFALDVTEQVRARIQTQDLILRLQQERELREQFVSALTHDLRSPLSAARMSAQLLARGPDDPDSVRKNAARIIANIDRVDSMIRDLLDANLIRAGETLPIHAAECDLHRQLQVTLDELATVHGDRYHLVSKAPVVGFWDCASIQRALENLCNNAVKYGSPRERISVQLTASADEVEISVHNWGQPLSSDEQKGIFKYFHRAAAARSSVNAGWGIGLTLVKGVAEAHRGSVSVTSSAREGTIFTLRIPRDARSDC